MAESETDSGIPARRTGGTGMARGIAHAITAVIAAFVAGFGLLFLLARAQDDAPASAHPLDFLLHFYRATGVVETFVATAIVWIALFVAITELLLAAMADRTAALRAALAIEIAAFVAFAALWYLP